MSALPADPIGDILAWLKAHPVLSLLHNGNVYIRLPDDNPPAPFLRIYRSGGGVQAGESPLQDIRVAVEVWGTDDSDSQTVRMFVSAMEGAAQAFQSPAVANPGLGTTAILNFTVNAAPDSPDPDTGWPRTVADTVFTVRIA